MIFPLYLFGFVWLGFMVYQSFCYSMPGIVGGVFASGQGDWGSIPGRVIPKTQKMVLDASFSNEIKTLCWKIFSSLFLSAL